MPSTSSVDQMGFICVLCQKHGGILFIPVRHNFDRELLFHWKLAYLFTANLIDILFEKGLSVLYESEGSMCPSTLETNSSPLETLITLDHKPSSRCTLGHDYFHGTSSSIIQYITNDNPGVRILYEIPDNRNQSHNNVPPISLPDNIFQHSLMTVISWLM